MNSPRDTMKQIIINKINQIANSGLLDLKTKIAFDPICYEAYKYLLNQLNDKSKKIPQKSVKKEVSNILSIVKSLESSSNDEDDYYDFDSAGLSSIIGPLHISPINCNFAYNPHH